MGSRITSSYSEDGRAIHVGKGVTVGGSPHRKLVPDMQGRSPQANLPEEYSLLPVIGSAAARLTEEPGAVVPHAGIGAGLRLASIDSLAACDGGPDTAEPADRSRVVRWVRSRARRSVDRENGGRNVSAW